VTAASAGWTSDSLVTGSTGVWRYLRGRSSLHKVVFGTDRVGHLVWEGGPKSDAHPRIWYNRYNPGSGGRPGSWAADFRVAPSQKNSGAGTPGIALDGDGRTFHVVWNQGGGANRQYDSLGYRKCTQDSKGKDKWGSVQYVYVGAWVGPPVVACVPNQANHVLVCWRQSPQSGKVTRLREYVNGAWQPVVRLDSTGPGPFGNAATAAAANGDVFVAYDGFEDGTSDRQIFVKTRHNGVWGEPVNVTAGFSCLQVGSMYEYDIGVNPATNNPHLVFEAVTEVTPDTFAAVYHTYRNASGVWTTPEVISEPHRRAGLSPSRCYPTMAFAGNGTAHVVWVDSVPPESFGVVYGYCASEGGAWSTPELLTSYKPSGGKYITVEESAHIVRVVWDRHLSDSPYCDQIWWKSNYLGDGDGPGAQPMALSQSGIELFPNPAKAGRVTVHYVLPHAGPMTVTLLDVSGRAVRRLALDVRSSAEGSFALDVRGLNAGVYVARMKAGDLTVSKSLVVGR